MEQCAFPYHMMKSRDIRWDIKIGSSVWPALLYCGIESFFAGHENTVPLRWLIINTFWLDHLEFSRTTVWKSNIDLPASMAVAYKEVVECEGRLGIGSARRTWLATKSLWLLTSSTFTLSRQVRQTMGLTIEEGTAKGAPWREVFLSAGADKALWNLLEGRHCEEWRGIEAVN